jgi:hypothetical protein
MKKNQLQKIELFLIPTHHADEDVIGFEAVADRLEQVNRMPGESLKAMLHRALWMTKGHGPLLVFVRTRG